MATTANAGSIFLAAANPRLLNAPNAAIIIRTPTNIFHVNSSGVPDVASIAISATLLSLEGTVTFSSTGCTVSSISGNTCAVLYTDMTANVASVTATLTYRGYTFSQSISISKVVDSSATSGYNNGIAYAYKRSATVPTDNPGAIVYDFTIPGIATTTLANSWSKTIPAGTNPLYVVAASASNIASTDNIAATEWSSPVVLAQNGTNGVDGLNVATVFIYQRTTVMTAPSLPSNSAVFTFSGGALTGLNNGWGSVFPAASLGAYLWVSTATAFSNTSTDTILATEWAAANLMSQDGVNGTGSRGPGAFYATGSSWSDTVADAATTGANVTDDTVTISNGTNFVQIRRWTGTAWIILGTVIDGVTLMDGTVLATKINSNGLNIRKTDGTLILDAGGGGLQAGFEAPGTKNSDVTLPSLGQNNYRVVSVGGSSTTYPAACGLYLNGTQIYGPSRSYMLAIINRATRAVVYFNYYDIFGGAAGATHNLVDMVNDLNSVDSSRIVVVWTFDEPQTNRLDSSLANALYRHGASRAVYGSSSFKYRGAYVLVGIGGCGEGNGAEAYQGAVDNDINAWCDVGFSITNGALTGFSGNAAGKAISDVINDSTTGLSSRLRNNADQALGGIISVNAVTAPAGFRAGTLTWNASGAYTGGYGTALTPLGLVGYKSDGTLLFSLSSSGLAVKGDISGSTGTFGAVTVGASMSSGQTAYNTGTGFWLDYLGRMSIGNSAGKNIRFDGTNVLVNGDIIGTSNLTDNSVSDFDFFSSIALSVPTGGTVFSVPSTSKLHISATIAPDAGTGSSGYDSYGYEIEKFNGTIWQTYPSGRTTRYADPVVVLTGVPAGSYRMWAYTNAATTTPVTNVTILKFKK